MIWKTFLFIIPGLLAILLVLFALALSVNDPVSFLILGSDAIGEEKLFVPILLLFLSVLQTILLIPAWRRVPRIWIVFVTTMTWALFVIRSAMTL